jgi:hypothetical protein
MEKITTEALRQSLHWQEYVSKTGKTPEQRERCKVRAEKLRKMLEAREAFKAVE